MRAKRLRSIASTGEALRIVNERLSVCPEDVTDHTIAAIASLANFNVSKPPPFHKKLLTDDTRRLIDRYCDVTSSASPKALPQDF